MPTRTTPPRGRQARRQTILELIRTERVRSQAELQMLLEERDLGANQATLSRDLRDLGVVKSRDGYELPADPALPPDAAGQSLWHAVREWLLSVTPAQNQIVLRTPPSGAQPLAHALDHSELPGLLGTIAGDDTVLAICGDPGRARLLARKLEKLKDGRP